MSIVGTRPPLISETNLYEPRHKARLALVLNIILQLDCVHKVPNILLQVL